MQLLKTLIVLVGGLVVGALGVGGWIHQQDTAATAVVEIQETLDGIENNQAARDQGQDQRLSALSAQFQYVRGQLEGLANTLRFLSKSREAPNETPTGYDGRSASLNPGDVDYLEFLHQPSISGGPP